MHAAAREGVRRSLTVIVLLALIGVLVPAPGAEAVTVQPVSSDRLLGDLTAQHLRITINGRTVRGDLLRIPRGAQDLELRPRLAQGTAVGLQTMEAFSRTERSRGAVAGINGGYWTFRPTGTPNGLYVERGRMAAADSSLRSGLPAGRAVAGIRPDGTLLADRLRVHLDLDVPAVEIAHREIDEFNRQPRSSDDGTHAVTGELLLFDGRYGTAFRVPAGSTLLVIDDLPMGSGGRVAGMVRERYTPAEETRWTVPEGTSAVLAYGTSAPLLDGVEPGMELGVTTRIEPYGGSGAPWSDLISAVPGAGLLIRDGRVNSGTAMSGEGIDHASTRRARTAVAQTGNGTTLLLTIDETRGSSGVTLFELAQILDEMGAVNAVAMDGGGSTAMTVDGRFRNSPSHTSRGHSSAWFVYAPLPPSSRGLDVACPEGTVPSSAFEDTTATVHAVAIDCLSWWEVTSGVTLTSYAPADGVTRGQMASFLVRWIDGVAARGDGNTLADASSHGFEDVRPDDVHGPAIARLSQAGIVQGRTATTYDPGAPVTRAETATLLRRALEHVQGSSLPAARDTFVDDTGSVHEASINQLAALGIVGGVGGFGYRPNDPVSRAAMASMIMRTSDRLVEEGRTSAPA